jgi:hypothetical protein
MQKMYYSAAREKVGGISILVFSTKCTIKRRPLFSALSKLPEQYKKTLRAFCPSSHLKFWHTWLTKKWASPPGLWRNVDSTLTRLLWFSNSLAGDMHGANRSMATDIPLYMHSLARITSTGGI